MPGHVVLVIMTDTASCVVLAVGTGQRVVMQMAGPAGKVRCGRKTGEHIGFKVVAAIAVGRIDPDVGGIAPHPAGKLAGEGLKNRIEVKIGPASQGCQLQRLERRSGQPLPRQRTVAGDTTGRVCDRIKDMAIGAGRSNASLGTPLEVGPVAQGTGNTLVAGIKMADDIVLHWRIARVAIGNVLAIPVPAVLFGQVFGIK